MANQVYANNMEVSCKAAAGKSICAFPDVCFTPPMTPATPPGVPIPYPNTGMASDTTSGSTSVQISGQEVMLKNKSYFQRSTGDEAGCAPKKGVITSTNMGKVYFNMWSMDVKIEGENVVRMLDLTTHNHMSVPGNTPTWPYIDEVAVPGISEACKGDKAKEEAACKDCPDDDPCKKPECREARKCMLVPYSPTGKQTGCCKTPEPADTPHHLIEVHCFTPAGGRSQGDRLPGFEKYDDAKAPCVCVAGSRYNDEHGKMHAIQNTFEKNQMDPDGPRSQMGGKDNAWNYGQAKKGALHAHKKTFPGAGPDGGACSDECLSKQIDAYHKQIGVKGDDTPLRADRGPLKEEQKQWGAAQLADLDE
jgi:hypothetical protein